MAIIGMRLGFFFFLADMPHFVLFCKNKRKKDRDWYDSVNGVVIYSRRRRNDSKWLSLT